MLIFRTILLWVAFILLIVLEFSPIVDLRMGIIFRLIPSFLLVIWFVAYFVSRQRYVFKKGVNKKTIRLLYVIRTIANISIVIGAVLRILHFPYSQLLLIGGIGFLAMWSSLLIFVSAERSDYNPEIVDDISDDLKEE